MINNELCWLQVDIILQETRLPESGIISERDYSFFWQGKAADETREHGVGFKLQLQTSAGLVSLISAYAPTLTSASELKDWIYEDLSAAISKVPPQEPLFIFGDFNARSVLTTAID